MTSGITPKDGFNGWDDYYRTLREVDRLVDSGELTPVTVEGLPAAFSDLFYFEDRSGARWVLAEPEPPARGAWTTAEGYEYGGELWEGAVRAPAPIRSFLSWGAFLKFAVWIEKMVEARELAPQDPDADRRAQGSAHEFVYRDGSAWRLRVPHFGDNDYGGFDRLE